VSWIVAYHVDYAEELKQESLAVREAVIAIVNLLAELGPQLSRPQCDTLKNSAYANMKELRFSLPDGEWRIAFAFDPNRQAILLVGGSKSGRPERRFYKGLIRIADMRYAEHLANLARETKEKQ
jgi:hypothetical protein